MVSYNTRRTGRHRAMRGMWDEFMRWGRRPPTPSAPYEEIPQYDVTPQPMSGAPVVPQEYTMGKLGYEAAPMPPNMPPNSPPMPPQLLSPHEQELLNQPQSEYDFMLDEIKRINAGLGQTTAAPPQATSAPLMVSEAPAPTVTPEEQWMLDEQSKIAEIRSRASTIAPEYADYGAPIPAEGGYKIFEDRYPKFPSASRREALTKLAPIHEGRRTAIKERFTEQRARKRERQLARGAAPTWPERAEHEMALAELGRTYPPAEKITAPEPRTREEILDEITQLQNIAMQYPDDPATQVYYDDLILARQEELATLQGGEIVTRPEETSPFVDRQWPLRNTPAVIEPVRRFKPTGQRKLTPKIAANFLQRANGDRELAQRMAAEEGYIE